MLRKCLVFAASAGVLLMIGVVAGPRLSAADDDETPLGKIMEKVNKANAVIQKGTRNKVAFAKQQKDVESSAKDLIKLAKEAKPITDAVKKAKDVAEPQKKWDAFIDELIKTSEDLRDVAAKSNATFQDAKDKFGAVKKVCTDCHKDFRVDESSF
jgi:cytochrome c556